MLARQSSRGCDKPPELAEIEKVACEIEQAVQDVPGTSRAYTERVTGGYYLDITPKRDQLARYRITVGDFQQVIGSALGGATVTTAVEGLERHNVSVRYPRATRRSAENPQRGLRSERRRHDSDRTTGEHRTAQRPARNHDRERAARGLRVRRHPRSRRRLLRQGRRLARRESSADRPSSRAAVARSSRPGKELRPTWRYFAQSLVAPATAWRLRRSVARAVRCYLQVTIGFFREVIFDWERHSPSDSGLGR